MTDVIILGEVGPQTAADGTSPPFRQGRSGEAVMQHLHGRFYEQNFRGVLYSGGMGLTSISAATFSTATLGATCTPVIGVRNLSTSQVNLVILQAVLGLTITALAATGAGPFVWATAIAQTGLTLGNQPLNRKTLDQSGSAARDMTGLALTGLAGNLTVRQASGLGGGSASSAAFTATAVAMQTGQVSYVEQIDGAIIVPPGGVLALLATTTPVAHSAASGLLWEEVAL